MTSLNLPEYQFKITRKDDKQFIFDSIRKKYVALTPEEWVRQNFIRYLHTERQMPLSLMAVETSIKMNGMTRRPDIVVYLNTGKPLLIVECKAPSVELTQDVFDQIARYNMVLKVKYLIVTNGLRHYCCYIDNYEAGTYYFLENVPSYQDIS